MVQGEGQRSSVVMARAGPEDIMIKAAAVALLGIHSNDARVAGKRKEAGAVNVVD